ncbi:MAG: rRNA (cytidine1920-2-O)/16S rRNA (cytidine1409-2-O)-methyltransferase [Actinomycetota bacterium]|nr:rRNA (cytidine1920-2-O)/16S rRNA (cytidine1409-2-O)-methyltransferase [Actinomycetota bacterium]
MTNKPRPTWQDVPNRDLHGREKLSFALGAAGVDAGGAVAFDCGASTGGFTRALLDAGVARVYAVDAGFGQLLGSLRQDPRVTNMERTNLADARVPEAVGIVTLDLSYLSLADALPQLHLDYDPGATLIALVKPMFELHLAQLPDDQPSALADSLALVEAAAAGNGWQVTMSVESPIRGRAGALEGFVHARRSP